MPSSHNMKKRRLALAVEQNWLCYWCKVQMTPTVGHARDQLPTSLTLDHLLDRFDPDRRKQAFGAKRYVASCFECNQRRGRQRQFECNPTHIPNLEGGRNDDHS